LTLTLRAALIVLSIVVIIIMDPLCVSNSIAGLFVVSGEVIDVLAHIIVEPKERLKTARLLHTEVTSSIPLLLQLQELLDAPQATPRNRTALIQIDQLVAVLTDGVLIFSDLEAIAQPLKGAVSIWERLQWVRVEPDLASILPRLEGFRNALTSILDIFQRYFQCPFSPAP
jgi:cell division control protein 24